MTFSNNVVIQSFKSKNLLFYSNFFTSKQLNIINWVRSSTDDGFNLQSRAGRGEKTSEDVQREKEARQVRRHAGRGS